MKESAQTVRELRILSFQLEMGEHIHIFIHFNRVKCCHGRMHSRNCSLVLCAHARLWVCLCAFTQRLWKSSIRKGNELTGKSKETCSPAFASKASRGSGAYLTVDVPRRRALHRDRHLENGKLSWRKKWRPHADSRLPGHFLFSMQCGLAAKGWRTHTEPFE